MEYRFIRAAGCAPAQLETFFVPLRDVCDVYDIKTNERIAAFLAQVAHESNSFRSTIENLNYSAEGLQKIFKKYFPDAASTANFAGQPERIANRVYANRLGNGSEASGDGWKFRGRGLIQITGKNNVREFSIHYCGNESLVADPSPMELPALAAMSAGWYWNSRELNALADVNDFEAITKAINGGMNGQDDREQRWLRVKVEMDGRGQG